MKKSEEARKLRDAKKFGKRVQTQRLLERQAEKSATLEKIASLRKKRGGDDDLKKGGSGGIDDDFTFGEEDAFDVSATHDAKRQKTGTTGSGKSAAAASGKRDYKVVLGRIMLTHRRTNARAYDTELKVRSGRQETSSQDQHARFHQRLFIRPAQEQARGLLGWNGRQEEPSTSWPWQWQW